VTYRNRQLSYLVPRGTSPTAYKTTNNPTAADNRPALILQRLACPYLTYQPVPSQPNYNPYITVDYIERCQVNNGRVYRKPTAANPSPYTNAANPGYPADYNPAATPPGTGVAGRLAYGKIATSPGAGQSPPMISPFASYWTDPWNGSSQQQNTTTGQYTQWVSQPAPAQAFNPPQPQNTFYSHNAVNAQGCANFDIHYHPDRPPISIMDLLHVSMFKPSELTHRVGNTVTRGGTTTTLKYAHRAHWAQQTATGTNPRILRLLEFLTIGGRQNGYATAGGRVPGKVNLNAVWDQVVFNALCDARTNNSSNVFTPTDVSNIWTNSLLASRSSDKWPQKVNVVGTNGQISQQQVNAPGTNSSPFWGLATGVATGSDLLSSSARGVPSGYMRIAPNSAVTGWNGTRLLEPPAGGSIADTAKASTLQRFELINKIAGNLTTRSNVFAAWVTIGFFKVLDPNARPQKLGGELIWPVAQTTIRHKFFCLIDRTQMQVWPTTDNNGNPLLRAANSPGQTQPVTQQQVDAGQPIPIQFLDISGNTMPANSTSVTNPNTGKKWQLQAKAMLTYDPNTANEETVIVVASGGGFQALFNKPHAANAVVICRGNPGPWTAYDFSQDQYVVPYQATIN
jgi:hypothetical protein